MNVAQQPEEPSIDLGGILSALWRAKLWIVPLVLLVAVGTFVGVSLMAPRYKAEARLLIESRPLVLRTNDQRTAEQDRALLDQEGVVSQVQLITSRDLARRVIAAEHLLDHPEFASSRGFLGGLVAALGLAGGRSISPEERALETFLERFTAFQVEKSRVIQVEFWAHDPDVASRIANAITTAYLRLQGESKVKDNAETTRWLEGEIAALRTKVAESEGRVETYRSSSELFLSSTNNTTLFQQQLSELNSQLTAARGVKSDAEAKSAQLRKIVTEGGSLDAATEIVVQPMFQRLRERQIALRSRIAELSAIYLPGHPQIQTLNSQLRDIDGQLRAEARKTLANLENDVKVADQRIRELRGQLGEFKGQATRANQEDVQLRALERDAKAQRDLLESLLARYREAATRANLGSEPPDARVISQASPPSRPYFPKVVPITSVVTLAVFLLCGTIVILRELLAATAVAGASLTAQPPRGRSAAARGPVVVASPDIPPRRQDPVDPSALAREIATDADAPILGLMRHSASDPAASATATIAEHSPIATASGAAPVSGPDKAPPGVVAAASALIEAAKAIERADAGQPDPVAAIATASSKAEAAAPPPPVPPAAAVSGQAPVGQAEAADARPGPSASVGPLEIWRRIDGPGRDARLVAVVAAADNAVAQRAALGLVRTGAAAAIPVCLVVLAGEGFDAEHVLDGRDRPGFADLVAGRCGFGAAIHRDSGSLAHVVPPGAAEATPLDHDRSLAVVEALQLSYEHVVVVVGSLTSADPVGIALAGIADHVVVATERAEADAPSRMVAAALGHGDPGRVSILATETLAAGAVRAA
ncbi:GumC family protein [Prosthecomicrobium hirschii]|uniref:GumC family protein n=1 Tax=Prosthecodimorpha hirschii TaxID=665126 RepID=UPI00222062A6|nr:Wzz/FepE/Etk N-terminal domain-containing protein [Prosthecomicrobium hirschii]MCW1839870.1 Wzz/FepE/Etk N-terminal domain-containing protein [Prosthecomicrobium hirschii]